MWEEIFSVDNFFFRAMSRLGDLLILNFIFLISCIPIITIGPALTALYYTAISTLDREDGYIVQLYVKSFKQNFKQSIFLWLILLFTGIILSCDVYVWVALSKSTGEPIWKPFTVISVIILCLYMFIFTFVWPLQAKFNNTILQTLKNAFFMAITHIPTTLYSICILALWIFCIYRYHVAQVLFCLLGVSSTAYLQAFIFKKIFSPYLEKPIEEKEEMED